MGNSKHFKEYVIFGLALVVSLLSATKVSSQSVEDLKNRKRINSLERQLDSAFIFNDKTSALPLLTDSFFDVNNASDIDLDSILSHSKQSYDFAIKSNNPDYLRKAVIIRAKALQKVDRLDDALQLLNKELEKAEKRKDSHAIASYSSTLAKVLKEKGFETGESSFMQEAVKRVNVSLSYGASFFDVNELVKTNLLKARVLYFSYQNTASIEILLELLSDHEGDDNLNPNILALIYNVLARNYVMLKEHDKAIDYAQKALEISETPDTVHTANKVMGIVYHVRGDHKKANSHYLEALNAIKNVDEDQLFSLYEKLGDVSLKLNDYNAGEKYYRKAIDQANKYPSIYSKMRITPQYGLALSHFKKGNFDKSRALALAVLDLKEAFDLNFRHGNFVKIFRDTYLLLSKIDEKKGSFKSSLTYHKNFFEMDSIVQKSAIEKFEYEKTKTIENLELAYEAEKKDNEIEKLKTANTASVLKNQKQYKLTVGLIIGSLVLAILLVFVIRLLAQKNKANQIIEDKFEENRLLMREMHHRVKNNLQIITGLLNAQMNIAQDDNLKSALAESQSKIKSIALVHQSLYQTDKADTLSKICVQSYFKQLLDQIGNTFNVNKKGIAIETEIEPNEINMSLAVPMGLIVNELVTNSLKYAFTDRIMNKRIFIGFKKVAHNGLYHLIISDNGKGLSENIDLDDLQSFGMQLVKGLVYQLDGEMKMKDAIGTNYEITVTEPETV